MALREKIDIDMYQGDDQTYTFTFYTDEAKTVEWDFSAASAVVMSVRTSLDAETVLFSYTPTNLELGNDWANGVGVFAISAANSALLTRDGKYDVQVTVAGKKTSPVYGDVLLQKQTTS